MGFNVGSILRVLLNPHMESMSFGLARNIDRSLYNEHQVDSPKTVSVRFISILIAEARDVTPAEHHCKGLSARKGASVTAHILPGAELIDAYSPNV